MDKVNRNNIPAVFRDRRYELVRSDKMYPIEGDDLFAGLVPEPKPDFHPESYPTVYTYTKLNPDDSLNILKELKFNKSSYIGLVNTYDNTIENTLRAFQIKFDILDSMKYSSEDFNKYSVILLDLRTYLYRPDVTRNNLKLLTYMKKGGNVICFYNKPSDVNGKNVFPYPIYITTERVTEEDAPVIVLHPEHDFFNMPDKMTSKDWDGWVQERNIYLPSDDTSKTSNRYQRLIAMQDEDDPVPSTSLLVCDPCGLGSYTYCALALYRQLKIFNKGALKLFLNMISQRKRFIE